MTRQSASGIIILTIIAVIFFFVHLSKTGITHETVDGHEYIRLHGWYDDDIEHSENCWCKKQ